MILIALAVIGLLGIVIWIIYVSRASKKWLLFILLAPFILIGSLVSLRQPILEGRIPFLEFFRNPISWMNLEPTDYYDYILLKDLPADSDFTFEASVIHKYKGTYGVGFILAKQKEGYGLKGFPGKIECRFLDDGREIFYHSDSDGRIETYYRETLKEIEFVYEVPRNVPLHKEVKVNVTISIGDKVFVNSYGPLKFFIGKKLEY